MDRRRTVQDLLPYGSEVFNNTFQGNSTAGLILTSLYSIYPRDTVFDLGPLPENNFIHDNIWSNNGYEPQGMAADLGIPDSVFYREAFRTLKSRM